MTETMRCRTEAGSDALAADLAELAETREEWHVQACDRCKHAWFPPRLRCPGCGSAELHWEPTGSDATLVSVVPVVGDNPRHRAPKALRGEAAYATGIVELRKLPGVRFPVLLLGDNALSAAVGDVVTIGSDRPGTRLVPTARRG